MDAGLTQAEAEAVTVEYADAQLEGLRIALAAVAIFAVLSTWFTRRLPDHPLGESGGAVEAVAGEDPRPEPVPVG